MPTFFLKRRPSRRQAATQFGRLSGYSAEIGRARPAQRRRRRTPVWSTVLIVICALILAGSVGLLGLFVWVARDLPDPNNILQRNVAQTTKIYDRTGQTVLYEVHGDQKRTVVPLESISKYVVGATIAAEDKDFYVHKGFDLRGIARAFVKDVIKGGKFQGGSTITQQLVKLSILNPEKTVTRKVKELILSIEMERKFTKDEILKMYLNEIPYGNMSYGIESAAQSYFGKPAKDLTASESALIVSIPKAPTYYSPYGTHTDALVARSHLIIDAMVEQGYLTTEEGQAAKEDDALARVRKRVEAVIAPHFVFFVRDLLAQKFGDDTVEQGGLKVITTLDLDKQKLAEAAISDNADLLKKWGANTAALLSLDPKNGQVLAMVGSADYFDESINGNVNALLNRLQPGSSVKPIMYAAAFEKGYTPDTVLYDAETKFKNYPEDYVPHDYDGKERGPVTVRQALAGSLNIPAVEMLYLLGIDNFMDFAKRLGYSTYTDKSTVGLSLVLGGADVIPMEHIAAFSAFAQDGMLHPTVSILRVEDSKGQVLYDAEQDAEGAKRVLDQEIARQIDSIMSDNAARSFIFGEKNYLTLPDRPVAAKTGTTNSYKDAWTIGFTPSLVTGVWVGIQQGGKMKDGADGSKVAAPIWNMYMQGALKDTPVDNFTAPQPVVTGKPILDGDKNARVTVNVDKISGKLATEFTPAEYVEQRAYGVPHSILFFVDKTDPRGPAPANPEADPQFTEFEAAVAKFAQNQQIFGSAPPTEKDDVHVPENFPTVSFANLADGFTVTDRTFIPAINAVAKRGVSRVDYLIDDETFASVTAYPFSGPITIPNRIQKGFHKLTARAFDDVGNRGEASVTINLNAGPAPMSIRWQFPADGQYLYRSSDFPLTMKFGMDDPKSIDELTITALSEETGATEEIGTIKNPPLPNMSVQWSMPAHTGRYRLIIKGLLFSRDTLTQELPVLVVP